MQWDHHGAAVNAFIAIQWHDCELRWTIEKSSFALQHWYNPCGHNEQKAIEVKPIGNFYPEHGFSSVKRHPYDFSRIHSQNTLVEVVTFFSVERFCSWNGQCFEIIVIILSILAPSLSDTNTWAISSIAEGKLARRIQQCLISLYTRMVSAHSRTRYKFLQFSLEFILFVNWVQR